jgi:hypothetical protein
MVDKASLTVKRNLGVTIVPTGDPVSASVLSSWVISSSRFNVIEEESADESEAACIFKYLEQCSGIQTLV